MKKFIKNKKGFTLVELIVCVAILGLISITVMGLISTGTNMFTNVQKRAMVMFKTQSVSTQLKSYIQSCSGLLISDSDDGNNYIVFTDKNYVYEVFHDKDNKELYLAQFSRDELRDLASGDISIEDIENDADNHEAIMSYNVSDINYKVYTDDNGYATAIKIDITISRAGQDYTRSETISVRSKVSYFDENNDTGANNALMSWLNA